METRKIMLNSVREKKSVTLRNAASYDCKITFSLTHRKRTSITYIQSLQNEIDTEYARKCKWLYRDETAID